jgi:hypothetical protein
MRTSSGVRYCRARWISPPQEQQFDRAAFQHRYCLTTSTGVRPSRSVEGRRETCSSHVLTGIFIRQGCRHCVAIVNVRGKSCALPHPMCLAPRSRRPRLGISPWNHIGFTIHETTSSHPLRRCLSINGLVLARQTQLHGAQPNWRTANWPK